MNKRYTAATYGEHVAETYDDWYDSYEEAAIAMLAELARGQRALELGIGTGRIALPLARSKVEVHGIDASPAMLAKLRAKPGGDRVPVVIGNFAEVGVEGDFPLIYVVFNTFFALASQEEQVRCFRNVARHLSADGAFLLEVFVPDVTRYRGGQVNRASEVTTERVKLDIARHDAVEQRITGQTVVLTDGSVRLYPVEVRYAWPSELDLMAQLAGLRLRQRWGGWQREPFTSESTKHVSIYERAGSSPV